MLGKSGWFVTDSKADRRGSYVIWDMGEDDIFSQVFVAKYDMDDQVGRGFRRSTIGNSQ